MHQRPMLNGGGVALALLLGFVTGPVLFYALMGDYWHSTGVHISQLYAGLAAIPLVVLSLFNAARFQNTGVAGAVTGAAAGVGEMIVAVMPWTILNIDRPHCTPDKICPYISSADLPRFILTVGIFSIGIALIAGFSLALLIDALRRMVHRTA